MRFFQENKHLNGAPGNGTESNSLPWRASKPFTFYISDILKEVFSAYVLFVFLISLFWFITHTEGIKLREALRDTRKLRVWYIIYLCIYVYRHIYICVCICIYIYYIYMQM